MGLDKIEKKKEKDQKYWDTKLKEKKEYSDNEEQWKKDLLKANPETPKPYIKS